MIQDKRKAEILDTIKLIKTRPFRVKEQGYIVPKKSIFNKIIGDSSLELKFAEFLENCNDIVSYAKNYHAVNFKIDYVKADGNIANYYPDFFVKKSAEEIFIIETKGREDLDVPRKIARLKQWCEDVNKLQSATTYHFVYVDEESFIRYKPRSFTSLVESFKEYQ